jgi:phosphoglycolate phosphatase
MDKIEHIVWDWNGTLLDDTRACVEAINTVMQRRGMPQIDRLQYMECFKFPVKDYYLTLGFDFKNEDFDSIAIEFHEIYRETSRNTPLREGIVEILRRMQARKLPMYVLSASETSILERMMTARNIRYFFKKLYGLSNIHANSKLEVGKTMMAELEVSGKNVLMIGDTIHDYEVARELGIDCVLVADGHKSKDRLETCSCRVLSGITELATLF